MQTTKRLSLDDFKLSQVESKNEIEKMLGEEAAACHKTCHWDETWLDFVDWEQA